MAVIMDLDSCPICWRQFSLEVVPTCLPCGHSFCTSCSSEVFRCGICRQRLPKNHQHRTNYALVSVLERVHRTAAIEVVHQETQTEESLPARVSRRRVDQTPSFFCEKVDMVSMRKTGLHFRLK